MAVPRIVLGNIFDSPCQTITNPVNCAGIMGAGLALQFRHRFPEMHADYVTRCKSGEVRLGYPYLFKRNELPWILNFPTKQFPRDKSDFLYIIKGVGCTVEVLEQVEGKSQPMGPRFLPRLKSGASALVML